jgi:nicotinate-nucleotide adenylyltransferase
MVKSAIAPFGDKCDVCDLEKDIEPPTYSYKVLEKIREQYPEDELFLICGSDTIDAVSQWKQFDTSIKDKVGFIEIKRNDNTEIENVRVPFIVREGSRSSLTNKGFWYIKARKMDISSTIVRTMVHNGMNPYPYVTEGVLKIINENNLYKQ